MSSVFPALLATLAVLACPMHPAVAGIVVDDALVSGPAGFVAAVIDGDTVLLDDGTEVRMTGIQAPKLPLGRRGFQAWPLAGEARAHLQALAKGREVRAGFGGVREDRHGRMLAHLFTADGTWLQGAMLRAGMARVYTFPDNTALAEKMLAIEAEARLAGRGLWGHEWYAVRTSDDPGPFERYSLVEGVVRDAAKVRNTVYLNFGADWRTDFTVMIRGRNLRRLAREGLDPLALEGQRIRVRGWVYPRNGAMIAVDHAAQIELLKDVPGRTEQRETQERQDVQ